MRNLAIIATLALISACASTPDEPTTPKPPVNRGVYTPGPHRYIGNDGKEHVCNPPGGHCSSDNRCHSSAEKCPIIR